MSSHKSWVLERQESESHAFEQDQATIGMIRTKSRLQHGRYSVRSSGSFSKKVEENRIIDY